MDLAATSPKIYRFGPFEVQASTGELRRDGERVKLQGQPSQILLMLLRANGEVVTRDALRSALWSSDTFVDFEHSLNTAVKKLRQALGDDPDHPRYVETVPRVGYRFLVPNEAAAPIPAPLTAAVSPAESDRRRPRGLWIVAAAAVCGALIAAVVILMMTTGHGLRITGSRQLTFHGNQSMIMSLASDGRRAYFLKAGQPNLYSVSVKGGDESSIPTQFLAPTILDISPDGSTLLIKEYANDKTYKDRVWLQPTAGGPARPLGDIQVEFAAAYSPDGKSIAFASQKTIYVTSDLGATSHPIVESPGTVGCIRWSPDGTRLRFTVVDLTTSMGSIWEARPNGKATKLPIEVGQHEPVGMGYWTHDGKYYVFQSSRIEGAAFWSIDESTSWFGARKPAALPSAGQIFAVFPSPIDNQIFASELQTLGLSYLFDPLHKVVTPFLPDRSVEDPAFSADGQWLTYIDEHNERSVVMRARADGKDAVPLTDPDLYARFPHFSPDASRIAFMGKRTGIPWRLYWISREGGALHEINAPEVVSKADANWMPDGNTLLFGQTVWYMADPNMPRAIYRYHLDTSKTEKLPNTDGWFSPRTSPDGKSFIALTADETKLGLYDFATANWRILFSTATRRVGAPYWSPDGNFVYFNSHDRGGFAEQAGKVQRVRLTDLAVDDVIDVSQYLPNQPCNSWTLAPDGKLSLTCWSSSGDLYALQYE